MRSARSHSRLRAPAAMLLALSCLAGCGGKADPLNTGPAEKAIAVSIAQQRHVIAIVACPQDVAARTGRVFYCTATVASGRQTRFRVVQLDGHGRVSFRALAPSAPSGS